MKRIFFALLLAFLAAAAFSCDSPTSSENDPIIVDGVVLDSESGDAIGNAIVRKFSPAPEVISITDADGRFSLELQVDSTYTALIEVRKEGFPLVNLDLLIIPDRDIILDPIFLGAAEEDDPDDPSDPDDPDDGDDDNTNEPSGPPSNIVLLSVSSSAISVAGTGENENAAFEFEVRDANGRPVDIENQTEVRFAFGSQPDGGEFLEPMTALTNEAGIATTNLTSGTVAGVTQVVAEFTRADGAVIQSRPVGISIESGLPDQDHFAVATDNLNVPGNVLNVQNGITALAGDRYGNVVQPGTVVYFTTDGGVIQGSAPTNDLGSANVTMLTGSPFPEHPDFGPGFATVRARTANDNDETIETSTVVLFSLAPQIGITPAQVNVENGGSQTFTYTVSDIHGNPMVGGTSIEVGVEGDNLDVIGDVSITMPDTQGRGPGITQYEFTLTDADAETEEEKPVQITIEVSGPNGLAKRTITGTTKLN
jgi:hypothetical protein